MIRNPAHLGLRYSVSAQELTNDTINAISINYSNLTDFHTFATGVNPSASVTINAQVNLSNIQTGIQKRVIIANNTLVNGNAVTFNITATGTAKIYNSFKQYASFNAGAALYFDIELMGDAANSILVTWGFAQDSDQGVVTEVTSTDESLDVDSVGTGDVAEVTSTGNSVVVTSFGVGDVTSITSSDSSLNTN